MNLEEDKKLTPQIIKDKLDNYIIGQDEVKKAVAIALSIQIFTLRNSIQKEIMSTV